jgi:hypothetical protein
MQSACTGAATIATARLHQLLLLLAQNFYCCYSNNYCAVRMLTQLCSVQLLCYHDANTAIISTTITICSILVLLTPREASRESISKSVVRALKCLLSAVP